jgi:hypothetical protein
MRVLIDDQPCTTPCHTVAEAIEAARLATLQDRRVIVEVIVDGAPWNDELESEAHLNQRAEEVRLISADQSDLINQTLDAVTDAISGTCADFRLCAELLQTGETSEAMSRLQDSIETFGSIQEALVHVADLSEVNVEAIMRSSDNGDLVVRMHQELERVQEAITAGDSIALADLLLYELPAVMSDLQDVAQRLRNDITRQDEG